jgi:hypothetical protein
VFITLTPPFLSPPQQPPQTYLSLLLKSLHPCYLPEPTRCTPLANSHHWGNTQTNKSSWLACQPYLLSVPLQGKCPTRCAPLPVALGKHPNQQVPSVSDESSRLFANHTYSLSLHRGMANTLCSTCSIVGETPQPTSPVSFRQIQSACLPTILTLFPFTREMPTRCAVLAVSLGNHPNQQVPSVSDEFSKLFCPPYLLSFPLQGKCQANLNTLCSTCSIVGETPQPTSPVGFLQIQ